ncbi:SNF2 family N-terminal domain-containing protein [Radiomyces spectabilis]|uniref:SNF2 family N-terminal domain-containing protein n=1 Tax=Radiomyces spectabilis TaxID=64574 RepID=UPI002220F252|nr:SNF2 family N-terminal domain-containing protein [Radiomyces spectabilis]KAI8388160.1 SNF2 family N-terminal domain-containing protein [Radiomyces spectabilis]
MSPSFTQSPPANPAQSQQPDTSQPKWNPNRYYIGELVISGWSIYKGVSPVKEGNSIAIERSKPAAMMQPPTKKNRFGHAQKKENTIVRFATVDGREIGRLPQDVSRYVSKLLDFNLCQFEATVVWCPHVLKIGDDIILQLRCYFNDNAFNRTHIKRSINQERSILNQTAETDEERQERDQTLALLGIIRSLGLKSSRSAIQRMNLAKGLEETEVQDLIAQSVQTLEKVTATATEEEETATDNDENKEVSDNQLDTIYEKAQIFDAQITPMETPETMAFELKPYQKRALAWMLAKEALDTDNEDSHIRAMHPLWEEYPFPKDPDAPLNQQLPSHFYFNPYSGELSLRFPESKQQERGGILADEMGLGKTIEILSLIHTNRFQPHSPLPSNHPNASPTTLIICPMSLLAQWRDEVVRASKVDTIKVEVYYGGQRDTDLRTRLCRWNGSAPDVLITTYGTVMSEWDRLENSVFDVEFWRIVLDEAHHIKNRLSKTSRACCSIPSRRRWAVTGTPIQNKLEDLFSLVRFLKHEPWANYTFWRTFITIPFEKKDPRALSAVQSVLEPIVLRRTKNMRDVNGDPMVPLPLKQINIEYLDFSPPEQDIYDSLYTDSKTKFSHFCAAGKALSNYASIFQLLMRLRQVSCHPYLVLGNKSVTENSDIMTKDGGFISLEGLIAKYGSTETNPTSGGNISSEQQKFGISVLQGLLDRQKGQSEGQDDLSSAAPDECPICFETVDVLIMMPCMHMACRPCVMGYLQKKEDEGCLGECPICRQGSFTQDNLLEVVKRRSEDGVNNGGNAVDIRRAVGGYRSSTKIDAMLRHLRVYQREGRKTVVFSQFTSFLDLIQIALQQENIRFSRLDGSQSQMHREKVLASFSSDDPNNMSTVLLISLRAGGVGLNLTCASRVLMMDPWWNFAVEAQAIDRVHRLGQQSDVIVTRFIMRDTVEERILEIQDRKHVLVNELYMSHNEAKTRQLQDLQILFGSRRHS